MKDAAFLLALRNDPSVRAQSRDQEIISDEEHRRWLAGTLQDPYVRLYVAVVVGKLDGRLDVPPSTLDALPNMLVGVLRLTEKGPVTEISFSVDPSHQRHGIGTWMLQQAQKIEPPRRLSAWVRTDNHASLKAFVKTGFRTTDTLLKLEWP